MKRSVLFLAILFFTVSPAQEFRFAVWGDSQFQNPEVFEETVKRTELLQPDFVIHVGDMIHGYTYSIDNARKQWQRFKKQISPLSVPFYPTPGNHDVTTKEIQPAYLEAWGNDKLYYSFDYLNSHFIILNTYLNQEFDTIPPAEMEWLKKDLEESKNKENIFVSLHSPLYLNKNYDWKPVHNLLKQYNVKAVFSGHYHYYDFRVEDGIKYFCLNSSGNMEFYNDIAGRSHHFLWVNVKGKDVNASVITKDKFYPADYLSLVSLPDKPEKNGTIIINDPVQGLDTTIYITLTNNSSFTKLFFIKPITYDFRWKFPWQGFRMILEPGKQQKLPVRISFPGGTVEPEDMPEIQITTEINYEGNIPYSHNYKLSLFNPPVTYAQRTNQEILLDGLDNETEWKSVNPIDELYIDRNNNPSADKTTVKVMYDHNNIYVFVKGEEPNVKGLTSAAYGNIPLVFGDDDFELYFDTDRDLKTFYRLMVNPKGTVLCSGPNGLFSFNFEVKTNTVDNYWSAEFLISLKELNVFNDIKGNLWGFNIRRHRQQAEIPQSDWSKMNTFPPYQPEYFGLLIFK